MKNPFKSKYYYAIIDKIAELENVKMDLENEKGKYKQTLQPERYVQFVCKIAEIESKIKILRGLL